MATRMKSKFIFLSTVLILGIFCLSPITHAQTISERVNALENENKDLKAKIDKLAKSGKPGEKADDGDVVFTKKDKETLDSLKSIQKKVQPFGMIGLRYHGFFFLDPGVSRGVNFHGVNTNFSRFDAKVQVGLKGEVVDGLNYMVRLGTASNATRVNSGYLSLSDFFNREPINLERFYLDWRPTSHKPLHVLIGKFQNPINQSQLIWDTDVGVNGVFMDYDLAEVMHNNVVKKLAAGPLFYYLATFTGSASDDVYVLGGSLQSQFAVGKSVNFIFNFAYYDYHNADGLAQGIGAGNVASGIGGTGSTSNLTPVGPVVVGGAGANTLTGLGFASDFNLVNPYFEVNAMIGKVPVKAYVDQVWNVGVAGQGNGHQYGIYTGAKVGGTGEAMNPWIGYMYYRVEADATPDVFAWDQADTNTTGHFVEAGITLAKNVDLFTTINVFKDVDPSLRGFGDVLGTLIPGISVPYDANVWMVRPRLILQVKF